MSPLETLAFELYVVDDTGLKKRVGEVQARGVARGWGSIVRVFALSPGICVFVCLCVCQQPFLCRSSNSELYLLHREAHSENASNADICTKHVQLMLVVV